MNTATTVESSDGILLGERLGNYRVTNQRLRRTGLLYAACLFFGAAMVLLHASPGWQAFGVGLWLPGAGFLAVGGWNMLFFPLALALFLGGVFLWWATGNVVLPAVIWFLAAVIAGSIAGETVSLPGILVGALAVTGIGIHAFRGQKTRDSKAAERRVDRNAYLPAAIARMDARAAAFVPASDREHTEEELGALRYVLDRSLQPIETFNGFDIIEQFQPSALRYQLNHLQYALAVSQAQYTPSFHGYVSHAQRNLIDKLTLPKVWSYWRLESLWGHLSLNYDPADRDNVMLTGWSGICINTYTNNTGDKRYMAPGSLTFALPGGRTYPHDVHTISQSVLRNLEQSAFCLYPCEPNWIYVACNLYGINALATYDRIFGTRHVDSIIDRFRQGFEEDFMGIDGGMVSFRSSLTGISTPASSALLGMCCVSTFANPVFPDISRRTWAIVRDEVLRFDGKGVLDLNLKGGDLIDPGNYKMSGAFCLAWLAATAREHGDDDVAIAAMAQADRVLERSDRDGIVVCTKASNFANALIAQARISRRGDWRNTIINGAPDSAKRGPLLTDASYPEVLVAKAFSRGEDLELVLRPGKAAGPQTLGLERLKPNGTYQVAGSGVTNDAVTADSDGRAKIVVNLQGRTQVHITPRA